jgi:hypothetical protein
MNGHACSLLSFQNGPSNWVSSSPTGEKARMKIDEAKGRNPQYLGRNIFPISGDDTKLGRELFDFLLKGGLSQIIGLENGD